MRLLICAAFAAAAFAPIQVAAEAPNPDPAAVLRAAKATVGGKALDALTGSYEEGKHGTTAYKTWLNYRRYGMKGESLHDGVATASGFNGSVQWRVSGDGKLSVGQDAAAKREAITTAYFSNNGFFYPDRFPAHVSYLRKASYEGRSFDVIEADPEGGRGAQLWFDRKTHLLGRIVDDKGSPPVAVDISDYRHVGKTLVAFRAVIRSLDGKELEQMQVASVKYRKLPASTFDAPASR
ncbi:MAG TPA: hypothetical protein VGL66_06735 [Caulobacteraceae bacterium]|jgi:hypothetical protein